jgi:hypothetical protein
LPVVVVPAVIDFWPPLFRDISCLALQVGVDVDRPNLLAMDPRTSASIAWFLYLAAAFFICPQEIT